MSTLLVEPIKQSLEQSFNLSLTKRYIVASMMPYLYLHNSPSGNFKFSILKNGNQVFEKLFNSEDIKAALNTDNDFAHVFYPIIPSDPLILGRGYFTVKIEAPENYRFRQNSFIGWVRQFEDLNNKLNYTPLSDNENPLALRFKEYKVDCAC